MLDFLKIKVTDAYTIKYFWLHPLLFFHSEQDVLLFDFETIKSKKVKQYKGLLFEFTEKALFIHFKPHYYFNDNLHNANDFSVLDCIKTLKEVFGGLFKVNLEHLSIINIEFGLNIIIPKTLIDIKDLLSQLIYHGQNPFLTDRKHRFCRFSNSVNKKGLANVYKIIKAYAKGIQFPNYTSVNTFRFEVKSNRKHFINGLGIFTIQDLFKTSIYEELSKVIIDEFNEVLIIDETAEPKLSKTKLSNFKKKQNPLIWNKFLMKSKNTFRRNFRNYHDALNTCDIHLKKELKKLLIVKLEQLKKCADLRIYKGKISTQFNNRNCLVTGLNISMQKDNSTVLSHTGLYYYYKGNKQKFDEVKKKYLSNKWINSDFSIQIQELAHNIRNTKNNRKLKQQRLYPPHQQNLFNIKPQ